MNARDAEPVKLAPWQEQLAATIYMQHHPPLVKVAMRLSRHLPSAKRPDYVQDVRGRTLETIRNRIAEGRVTSIDWPQYLSRLPGHVLSDYLRRLATPQGSCFRSPDFVSLERRVRDIGGGSVNPLQVDDRFWNAVRRAVDHDLHYPAFELAHRYGLTAPQISAELGIPVTTVKNRIHHARVRLEESGQEEVLSQLAALTIRAHEMHERVVVLPRRQGD